jgi:predicted nucleic acid-binding protein
MSSERATYLDSTALLRLVVRQPESAALRLFVRRRRPLISSVVVRIDVGRALLPFGPRAFDRGNDVLTRVDLVRLNDRIANIARTLPPTDLRPLDAIHLATALELGEQLDQIVTYDDRTATGARDLGLSVVAPT